jgi:hypothetical protein
MISKKAQIAMLIKFKLKTIKRDKDNYIRIKGIDILAIVKKTIHRYAPNIGAPKYIRYIDKERGEVVSGVERPHRQKQSTKEQKI